MFNNVLTKLFSVPCNCMFGPLYKFLCSTFSVTTDLSKEVRKKLNTTFNAREEILFNLKYSSYIKFLLILYSL
jgi:adenine C2-methylase RlmN of 23S rRNA A2503 and tRNA A37